MALACIPADHRPAQYLYIFFRQLAPERLSGADGVTSQSVSQLVLLAEVQGLIPTP